MKTTSLKTRKLSFYRTLHHFPHYGEFSSVADFEQYLQWAEHCGKRVYILGNGSNTLFKREKVQSLVLKNNLSKGISSLGGGRFEVSSASLVKEVLDFCYARSLSSFYYLASVPATTGGALAMNAGRGRVHSQSIYDFVESVTFYDIHNNEVVTLPTREIVIGYRETIFNRLRPSLILSAVFRFEDAKFDENPILERLRLSKKFQDYSAPNCGSVFKQAEFRVLERLQGLSLGKACFSNKTRNWILNKSENGRNIFLLIYIVKVIHAVLGKAAKLEVVIVE